MKLAFIGDQRRNVGLKWLLAGPLAIGLHDEVGK
jgi:hypothetical protein